MSLVTTVSLAILTPLLGSIGVLCTGRWPNVREAVSTITTLITCALVCSLVPDVMAGARPDFELFEVLQAEERHRALHDVRVGAVAPDHVDRVHHDHAVGPALEPVEALQDRGVRDVDEERTHQGHHDERRGGRPEPLGHRFHVGHRGRGRFITRRTGR